MLSFPKKSPFLVGFISLLLLSNQSIAEFADIQHRFEKFYEHTVVDESYTAVTITEVQAKVLNDNAVKKFKNRRFSFSTSIEQFDVLEAYTLKSSGEKVEVPDGNYQKKVNSGFKEGGPIFSDRTSITVVFPDLEVNDSIYYKVRRTETEPMFPMHFSDTNYFWREDAYDDVKVTIELPKDMFFLIDVRGMNQKENVRKGQRVIALSYKNKNPIHYDRKDFSVWNDEEEAGFAISTYKDYQSIAAAYYKRAKPKAAVTDRIEKLAKDIVGKEKDAFQKTRLLYNWVTKNISYAGNCIGVGAVVPHDTDFILDNRMGDCKDHATLLEALLTSQGIESTQALINSGSRYELPKIPLVSAANHVITYLPEWDMFVDSTYSGQPFDTLHFSVQDKPVILAKGFVEGKRTPASKSEDNVERSEADAVLNEDGSLSGTLSVSLKGSSAVSARAGWRGITEQKEKDWLTQSFSSRTKKGEASMTSDDAAPLLSTFNYSIDFRRPEYIPAAKAGGMYLYFPMFTPQSIYSMLNYPREDLEGYQTVCGNGQSFEKIYSRITQRF